MLKIELNIYILVCLSNIKNIFVFWKLRLRFSYNFSIFQIGMVYDLKI